jgi:murein L,D-transpeptidase YcbB/YkuD
MSGRGITRIVAGTALALVFTTAAFATASAAPLADEKAIEALVPVPDFADVPPPTAADVTGTARGEPPMQPSVTEPASPSQPSLAKEQAPPPDASPAAPRVSPDSAVPAAAESPPPTDDASKAKTATLPPLDLVAEKLHELVAGKLDRYMDRKHRAAVEAFYAARNFAPLWVDNGAASERAKAVIARLRQADTDGLDPSDYRVPDFAAATGPDALADAELKLTATVIAYARHAQAGRVHFSRVSADIIYNLVYPEPADVLTNLAAAKDVAEALGSYNPPHAGFKALKAKLAETRARHGDAGPLRISGGPTLRVGMQDPRVPLLRERLQLEGDASSTTYDKVLAEAVRKFQRERELSATGSLNQATVEALNGPRRDHDADIIIANMERWRWLPRDLGKAYVMVNIPDYTLRVVNRGTLTWRTKVVVGKPAMPTPLLSEPMRFITVNPTWNVPPSIVQNEYLPALQQDPTALDRIGLKVDYNRDGTVHIYQPPGDRNALGRIRFNFPNKFLVYQHDTPDKNLFAQNRRAFSHGCMRVENPLTYGEVLLAIALPKEGYTAERLHHMFGSAEQNINFPTPIPVHLTYQTAFVDENDKLQIREDVYGRDARLLAILKGDERRVADIGVERPSATRRQAVRLAVPPPPSTGLSFFEQLFGGPPQAANTYRPGVPIRAR